MMHPDELIALGNSLMREAIAPAVPDDYDAVLFLIPRAPVGLSYAGANGDPRDLRAVLQQIIAAVDQVAPPTRKPQ